MSFPEGQRQTVHVIDDDVAVQQVVALWLNRPGLTAKAYVSAEQFLANYQPAEIECLLLDLLMPGTPDLDLQGVLNLHRIQAPQIVISAAGDMGTVVRAMRNGATEFLRKPLDEQRLLQAVTEALAIDRETKTKNADLLRRIGEMSLREREILALLVAAKTTPEIAKTLSIRPTTVEKHCSRIFERLAVDTVPALIRLMRTLQR